MTPAGGQGTFGADEPEYDDAALDDLWNRNAYDEIWRVATPVAVERG